MAKSKAARIGFDALPVKQGNRQFYLTAIRASVLWKLTQINRRSEDKEEGYQRAISNARVRSISKYVQAGGVLPGSVVVSFDEGRYSQSTRKLRLTDKSNIGWIIDGQHRLAGAHQASEKGVDVLLPVIAFLELPLDSQIELFVTINREARGVPASLYIDLLGSLPKKKTEKELTDERIADVARSLDSDELSPFYQKIIFTRNAVAGEISLNNFARIIRPHISRPAGTISLYTPQEQEGAINNYYKALKGSFPRPFRKENSIFYRTLGFGAVFRAFPLVFSLARTRHNTFSVSAIAKIFAEVQDFDFDKWEQAGTGSAAEINAGDDLTTAITEAFEEDGAAALKLD